MGIIKAKNVVHEFFRRDEEGNVESITTALDHVNLDVKAGQFIAILGHNGSGKSTLAKHINALLTPTEGVIWVDGMDVLDEDNTIPIRKTAGMVFQNPDNQIIASVVEEDVGFGPENIGVPTEEIWTRVNQSLEAVDMVKYRKHSPNKLSGGQKQRLAIARAIAKKAKVLVFDDSFSALDMKTDAALRKELNEKVQDASIVIVAQRVSTILHADQILVLDDGKIVGKGTHEELLKNCEVYLQIAKSQLSEKELGLEKLGLAKEKAEKEINKKEILSTKIDEKENNKLKKKSDDRKLKHKKGGK